MIETIPAALAGERIDRVVALLTGLSRASAAELVDRGDVVVGGSPITARSARVHEGDELVVTVPVAVADAGLEPDPSVAVPVVYEDDDVVVVDKPAGLVVHPGAGNQRGTLAHGLLARFPDLRGVGERDRPGIVHRLDKDTSGLLMVARNEPARRALVAQLVARTVSRCYRALVWGHPSSTRGAIDAPIGRSGRERSRMTVSSVGRAARTGYEVVETFSEPVETALLECRLETGRTHQIRVHLAAIGHPVVGDHRYGGARQSLSVPRFFLHAAHLGFDHPRRGEPLRFDSPLPADLAAVLGRLG